MAELMRILTVRQPWAHAIIHGGKNVENRVRNLAGDYRGPVAIHAGLQRDDRGWVDAGAYALTNTMNAGHPEVLGAIIGVVDLVGVHHADKNALECADRGGRGLWCSRWADPGVYHLALANPRPLSEPIPYKGGQGLRWVSPELQARIEAHLG